MVRLSHPRCRHLAGLTSSVPAIAAPGLHVSTPPRGSSGERLPITLKLACDQTEVAERVSACEVGGCQRKSGLSNLRLNVSLSDRRFEYHGHLRGDHLRDLPEGLNCRI